MKLFLLSKGLGEGKVLQFGNSFWCLIQVVF
jgi:hypothetical protein